MKFYYIPHYHADKIPLELYKDKVIVLAHSVALGKRFDLLYFDLIFDYKAYHKHKSPKLVLHKLTLEDFTHLNLLGIPIYPSHGTHNKELAKAIKLKRKSFVGIVI